MAKVYFTCTRGSAYGAHEANFVTSRGVMIHIFVLNRSVQGFRFGTRYKLNDLCD